MVLVRPPDRSVGVFVAAVMKRAILFTFVLTVLAGCSNIGGGGTIEPESKSGGSPILNRDKAPATPPAKN